jgi:adenine/guanine phosphoribosyltransferase-like PRPP-binding protein
MLDLTNQIAQVISHPLETGVLTLRLRAEPAKPLFRLAERINPKRSFLFVSTVLGRHIPVRPSDHMEAVRELVQRCDGVRIPGPVLVLGYAETAVGLGAAVARELASRRSGHDLLYLSTTRHPVPGREWVRFSEGHSHATEHHVLRPDPHAAISSPDSTLVLVDDETTTGSTFVALIQALLNAGVRFARVILITLTDWSDGAAARAVANLNPDMPVTSVSLLRGSWTWEADRSARLPDLPGRIPPAYPEWAPLSGGSPRDGVRDWSGLETERLAAQIAPQSGEPILIIGTGEHVWEPMLLGEHLEREGAEVRVIATTRSPILPGEVIRHKLIFPDHFGIGVPMYLHNVPPRPKGRVVVMTETGADRICPALRTHLGRGIIIDRSGQLTEFCES